MRGKGKGQMPVRWGEKGEGRVWNGRPLSGRRGYPVGAGARPFLESRNPGRSMNDGRPPFGLGRWTRKDIANRDSVLPLAASRGAALIQSQDSSQRRCGVAFFVKAFPPDLAWDNIRT